MLRQILILIMLCCMMPLSEVNAAACAGYLDEPQRNQKIIKANLYGVGLVTAWGVAKWDYFSRSIHSNTEGWFGNETKSGGADKLGHFYASYVTSHGLSYLFERQCINKPDAALYGALSSFVILSYMELGDSFSDFGFSYEDLIINTLGSAAGYFLYRDPAMSNKIDIRWEYGFHRESDDFTTDYENSKYLVALKLNGFEKTRKTFLKHIEIHLGYYTRGFSDPGVNKERNLYLGVGFNLTDFFKRRGHNKTATFFKYMQLPGTYIETARDINK